MLSKWFQLFNVNCLVLICAPIILLSTQASGRTREFIPFTQEMLQDPLTGIKIKSLEENLKIEIDCKVYFDGPVKELLSILNRMEEHLNQVGLSLHDNDGIPLKEILSDPGRFIRQALVGLRLPVDQLTGKVKEALHNCPKLSLRSLGINPKSGLEYLPHDRVDLADGLKIEVESFVDRINDQQQVLCSLGLSVLSEAEDGLRVASAVKVGLETILNRRTDMMQSLGISKFNPTFNLTAMQPFKETQAFIDEARVRLDRIKQDAVNSLFAKARQISIPIPEHLRNLPDLPNLATLEYPKREDLALKKRKEWTGLNIGERNRFNIYTDAFFEVRGSETEIFLQAEGKAGFWVFDRNISALQGYADFTASTESVSAQAHLRALGFDLLRLDLSAEVEHQAKNGEILHVEFDEGVDSRFFVGPVPVSIKGGARARVHMSWGLQLAMLNASAGVTPGVGAEGYIQAALGFTGVLAVGAEGSLILLRLEPTLQGRGALSLDKDLSPQLNQSIRSQAAFNALAGALSVFAEYPVPQWSLPPWQVKRSSVELVGWAGLTSDMKIMDWGVNMTPFGVTMTGDLIDQTDHSETRGLQHAIFEHQRQAMLVDLENKLAARTHAVFSALKSDLEGAYNLGTSQQAPPLIQAREAADRQRGVYERELMALLKRHGADR